MKRATTWIPLAIIGGLSYLSASAPEDDIPEDADIEKKAFTSADAAFTLGFSYNAGTHEEAVFRGWMQPVLREYTGSYYWANGITSLAFAAAHLGSNELPIIQAVLGYHLGYVTHVNGWRIGEAVFIHTWWDVFAFAGAYHYKRKLPEAEAAKIKPTLWLPSLRLAF